jgi:hypothetical protein
MIHWFFFSQREEPGVRLKKFSRQVCAVSVSLVFLIPLLHYPLLGRRTSLAGKKGSWSCSAAGFTSGLRPASHEGVLPTEPSFQLQEAPPHLQPMELYDLDRGAVRCQIVRRILK